MRLLISFTLLFSLFTVGACALHEVKGEVGGIEVEAKTKDGGDGDGDFCPPGQAKKGNC